MKNKKKFMIGAFSIGLTAIAVAIVIALNVFVALRLTPSLIHDLG